MAGRTALATDRVMEEMGNARLDDLAEHLGYHRNTVQRKAEQLVAEGKLELIEGVRGPGGEERQYKYGDGSPEQGMAEEPPLNAQQRAAVDAAIATFEANAEVVLQGWEVIDGAEFHDGNPAPADRVYVEFRYLDPHRGEEGGGHRPGREVHVYSTEGKVLECQDFG